MKLGSSLAVGNPYNNSDDDMLAVSATTLSEFLLSACLVVPVSDQRVKASMRPMRLLVTSQVNLNVLKIILQLQRNSFYHILRKKAILQFNISLFIFEVKLLKQKHIALGMRIRVISLCEVYKMKVKTWDFMLTMVSDVVSLSRFRNNGNKKSFTTDIFSLTDQKILTLYPQRVTYRFYSV